MSGRLGIAGLTVLGCVAAAAGGGYWALRSNAHDFRQAAISEPGQPVQSATGAVPLVPTDNPPVTAAQPEAPTAPAQPLPEVRPETRRPYPALPAAISAVPPAAPVDAPAAPVSAPPATTSVTADAPVPISPAAPVAPQAPPPARYDEVTIAADSVLGLRLDSTISTETARVEDRVTARLSRDVLVDGRVALPAGARLEGVVTQVERGGKFKDRPRLGIVFNALVLADGTRMALQTDTIFRDGESPAAQANTKVGGGAAVGAILGAMIGGKKGALIGSTAGAAGGAAAVAAGDRANAVMRSGTPLTARLSAPVTLLIERNYEK